MFAENGAFAALFQISDRAMDAVNDDLGRDAKNAWADKSPMRKRGLA